MKELTEILSALLVLNGQLSSGVPLWFAASATLGIVLTAYAWVARKLMNKKVRAFSNVLYRGVPILVTAIARGIAGFLNWLSAQPERMCDGVSHPFWRKVIGADLIVLGAASGLRLFIPLWVASQVLALPEHPRFYWAGPLLIVECYCLFLCARLVRAGWKNVT